MDPEEIGRIAQAYVEYATWFIREGTEKFSAHQAKVRAAFAPQFGAIFSAISRGPEAVWKALEANGGAFSERLDQLKFESHPAEWARDRAGDILRIGGKSGWILLQEIVDRAPDADDVLGFIGAGPFEDWVSEERVVEVQEELTRVLSASSKFQRVALASWDTPPTLHALLRQLGLRAEGPV